MIIQDSSSQTSRNDMAKTVSHSRGFTLIELIIVMVIFGILAIVGIPKYVSLVEQAKISTTQAGLGAVRSALNMGLAGRLSSGQPPFPAQLTALDFADGKVPMNKLNDIEGVIAVATMPSGLDTSTQYGFWYIQANGLSGAYSDGAVDTSGW